MVDTRYMELGLVFVGTVSSGAILWTCNRYRQEA